MKWPRRKGVVEGVTLDQIIRLRRKNGRLLIASALALWLFVNLTAPVFYDYGFWPSLFRFLGFVVFGSVMGWNYVHYRKWDRRAAAVGVVVAMQAAGSMREGGIYTQDEANEAFTDYMRGIR